MCFYRLNGGIDIINSVDASRFPLLVGRVAQGLAANTSGLEEASNVFSPAELEKLQVSLEQDEASLKLLLESLTFILKQVIILRNLASL
jgi:hypothetical protein